MAIDLEITTAIALEEVIDLLLLADPSEAMIRDYMADAVLHVARWDGVVVGVFVLMKHDERLVELKNIAVSPEWQGKGIGKVLVREAISAARALGAKLLEVGTGNSSFGQLAFYQKAGFRMKRVVPNYFSLNYDEPITENGIRCLDRVVLVLDLEDEPS